MLDRTILPRFQDIEPIHFPWPDQYMLGNNMPLYVLNIGSQPIVELELIFKSGSCYEMQPGAAYFTAGMLLEGTKHKDTQAIAQIIDYYGATISTHVQKDFSIITLSALTKYLKPLLDLLLEVLLTPSFPEKSLQLLKNIKIQAIQMADKKNNRIAYKQFCSALFTETHPYGRQLTLKDVHAINQVHLQDHYQKIFFTNGSAFVSGKVSASDLSLIKKSLELLTQKTITPPTQLLPTTLPRKIDFPDGQHLQSAIVIGKKLLIKKEVDFLPMVVVNTLLGGYFGSRLMQNIREDKGYTYGIHSSMISLLQAGYLVISTEVAQEVTQATVQEIYKEISVLQHELITQEALANVKNYLLGHFLTTINDPFSIMQKFQATYLHGSDQSYYTRFYDQVRNITPLEIRKLAQKYLSLSSFTEVIVH